MLVCVQLGDVHAHLGSWSKASEAWSSAVDALLGVYQVVDVWRTKLELGNGEQQLKRYGVHGLLLAVSLLGKLARWARWCVWESSDEAHLGTRPTGLLARSAALHLCLPMCLPHQPNVHHDMMSVHLATI